MGGILRAMTRPMRAARRWRWTGVAGGALLAGALAAAGDPPEAASGSVAFVHVHVVPMDSERVLRDQTVLVEDGRIARIGAASDVELPPGAQTIDGRGELFLLPGLCDAHVHVLEPDELRLYVAQGVTTVRNMSGEPFHLFWRGELAAGRMTGANLITAGPTLDGVPPEGSNRVIVRTREQAESAVRRVADARYDLVKVYGGLSPEAHAAIVETAHRLHLKVAGHLPRAAGLEGVLAAGQDSIEHAEEFLYTAFRNAGAERIPETVRAVKSAGTWVTPTLVTYDTIGRQVADATALDRRPELRCVDPAARASWLTRSNRYLRDFTHDDAQGFSDRLVFLKELVRQLHAGGVPLLAGTDAGVAYGVPFVLPGWSLHEELANLVACGLSPYEALRAATANLAEFMDRAGEFGVVAEGARADLLLVEANPLQDVANAGRLVGVMLRGQWKPADDLRADLDALERLYRDEAELLRVLRADGVAAAAERFHAARAADPRARLFRESALNGVGYQLLDQERLAEAVAAFELNVEAYPGSADVYDSLGEACMAAGNTERAIASYERSLELNPANANAAAQLETLRAGAAR